MDAYETALCRSLHLSVSLIMWKLGKVAPRRYDSVKLTSERSAGWLCSDSQKTPTCHIW